MVETKRVLYNVNSEQVNKLWKTAFELFDVTEALNQESRCDKNVTSTLTCRKMCLSRSCAKLFECHLDEQWRPAVLTSDMMPCK